MPADKPLLLFPRARNVPRLKAGGGAPKIFFPTYGRQAGRLNAHFDQLNRSFREGSAQVREDLNGAEPENVIVFETVGTVAEFYKAVRVIEGLEWLFEFEGNEVEPDEDFHGEIKDGKEPSLLDSRLYLIMTDQQGIREMMRLWREYRRDGGASFPRGQKKWKDLFNHLKSLRYWDSTDRTLETGISEHIAEIEAVGGVERISLETELWYRENARDRLRIEESFRTKVLEAGGQILSSREISEIRYHGVLIQLPLAYARSIIGQAPQNVRLAHITSVMYFRPNGQSIFRRSPDETEAPEEIENAGEGQGVTNEPFVALLDGLPQENHPAIASHITVDDPEDIATNYPASARWHGTAMASLIVNGDLSDSPSKLRRKIYVRPILACKPIGDGQFEECTPENELVISILLNAVERIVGSQGVAPTVRIINLSIAERYKPFVSHISALARLVDWLAYKYNLVFVVSAGNYTERLSLNVTGAAFEQCSLAERETHIVKALAAQTRVRRLLSPAESINALSVGAAHSASDRPDRVGWLRTFHSEGICAAYSAHGPGVLNAIKPDILAYGGEAALNLWETDAASSSYKMMTSHFAHGQRVAVPPLTAGAINSTGFSRGTSNSAALVSRLSNEVLEQIVQLRNEQRQPVPNEYLAVLVKSLVAHGCHWGQALGVVKAATGLDKVELKTMMSRMLGYGKISPERSLFCDSHRATVLGYGNLKNGEAHEYSIPLPVSLSGAETVKRIVVTLAWVSPIEAKNKKYRKSALWFDLKKEKELLKVARVNSQWQAVRRGTLQHEVYEGDDLVTFARQAELVLTVNCREDAGKFEEAIRYGIAVTIESADQVVTTIYDQIRDRLATRTQVRA